MNETLANKIIDYLQQEYDNPLHDYDVFDWERFNYCNAYIAKERVYVSTNNIDYEVIAIRSYETIVAFIEGNDFIEVGKYSRTTSKQVSQIYNQMFSDVCNRLYFDRK